MPPLYFSDARSPIAETELNRPSARFPYWREVSPWGQSNGPDEPLDGWSLGGTLLGCLFAAVVIAIVAYCGWKYAAPRRSYYETAMKTHQGEETGKPQRGQTRSCPQLPSPKVSVENWWDAAGNVDDDDPLRRPSPARTHSRSACNDIEHGDLYAEAYERVANKWSS